MSEQTHPGVCAVYVDLLRDVGALLGDFSRDPEVADLRDRVLAAVTAWDQDAIKRTVPPSNPAVIVQQATGAPLICHGDALQALGNLDYVDAGLSTISRDAAVSALRYWIGEATRERGAPMQVRPKVGES